MVHVIEVHVPASPSFSSRPESFPFSHHSPKSDEITQTHQTNLQQTPNSDHFEPVPLTSPKARPSVVTLPCALRTTPPSVPIVKPATATPQSNKRKKSLIQTIFDKLRHSPSNSYSAVEEHYFCRICHEGSDLSFRQSGEEAVEIEPLISPCKCSGSVGLIHRSCLEKWLSTANGDRCEICGHEFTITAKAKPFKQWLLGGRFGDNHRNLTADLICFVVLTPLASISAYLCGAGAAHYLYTLNHMMEAVGLMFLACFLGIIYIVWIVLSLRFHLQTFRDWQKNNQDIRLVEIVS